MDENKPIYGVQRTFYLNNSNVEFYAFVSLVSEKVLLSDLIKKFKRFTNFTKNVQNLNMTVVYIAHSLIYEENYLEKISNLEIGKNVSLTTFIDFEFIHLVIFKL